MMRLFFSKFWFLLLMSFCPLVLTGQTSNPSAELHQPRTPHSTEVHPGGAIVSSEISYLSETFSNSSMLARSNNRQTEFNAELLRKKYSKSSDPDPANPFDGGSLAQFKMAGDAKRLSMWLKFGSNIAGYMGPIIGSTDANYFLSIVSTGASIFSDYKVGEAGSFLYEYGNGVSPEYGFKLSEAGNHLRSYRTMSFISSGLGLVSTFLLASAASDLGDIDNISDQELSNATGKLIAAGTAALSGFIVKIFAVNHVGKAGENVESFSNDLQTEWQKHYLAESGANLKDYNKRWDNGMGLIFGGLGIALAGGLASGAAGEPGVAVGGGIIGGILALVGIVYTDWLAPASMGSAGSNLNDFEARMRNLDR